MASNALNPVGQAVQGAAEMNWTGEFDGQRIGDDQSAYYSTDEKGNLNRGIAWTIADTLNALMAVPNLIALLALSPVVVKLTREQLAAALGKD